MKKKLNGEAGFTLMEMLAATAILVLLAMMLSTGLQMTVNSYQKITAQSEVDLLVATAMDALVDELRFARDIDGDCIDPETSLSVSDDPDVPFAYTSDFFGGTVHLELVELDDGTQQIMAKKIDTKNNSYSMKGFLSTGVYGGKPDPDPEKREYAYSVTKMEITRSTTGDNTFMIVLEAQAKNDETIKASRTVTIRCLNKVE